MKPIFRQNDDDIYNCVFMVYKTSDDVKQIRIDFEDFEVSWRMKSGSNWRGNSGGLLFFIKK